MTDLEAWTGRLRSRWRKWRRDPAGFVDDLPSPPLRSAAIFGLLGICAWADLFDFKGRLASLAWRRSGVSLRRVHQDGAEFRFQAGDGSEPPVWPDRVLIRSDDVSAVVVTFAAGGGGMTAAEIGPGKPGLISLRGKACWARVYRIDNDGHAPDHLDVSPVSRDGLVHALRGAGKTTTEALKVVWPPTERRAAAPDTRAYEAWIDRNEPGPMDEARIRAWLGKTPRLPRISIILPVRDPKPLHLRAAIQSVRNQIYDNWVLCVADDGSTVEDVRRIIRGLDGDPRIKTVTLPASGGVVAASNAALALAEGDVALFLDHDDTLAPHALAMIGAAFAERPDAVAVYSDEDTLDSDGRRSAPVFKPELDRERLLAQNYVNHAFAVRLDLLRELGGLRPGLDGAQDHDLVLRVVESGRGPILHIPHVLYHWRIYPGGNSFSQSARAKVDPARVRLVYDHLERTHRTARLDPGPRGHLIVRRPVPDPAPEVLAIIPTRDRPGLLEACVAGLLEQTDYPALKVCVIDNGSRSERALYVLDRLASTPRVSVLRIDAPFNFSALNNAAVATSSAQVLVFVNDDVMVAEPDWLKAMVALAVDPTVGAVGAQLFYPDGRTQHAGIVLGVGPQRVAGHEFRGAPGGSPGPQNRLLLGREASAVTAACMAVAKSKFDEVGGFDEEAFPVAFNDVDLCLRLALKGYRTIWTPQARLMHLESATRGSDKAAGADARFAAEARRMRERWGTVLQADPYYNPNLTLEDESFTLAAVSRARMPWRKARSRS